MCERLHEIDYKTTGMFRKALKIGKMNERKIKQI